MLSFLRWFSKEGEYAHIVASVSVHPERAEAARRAIVKGAYEDRGTRDDGALILVTRTEPPLVVVARVESQSGGRPDLRLIHVAEVRGTGIRYNEP